MERCWGPAYGRGFGNFKPQISQITQIMRGDGFGFLPVAVFPRSSLEPYDSGMGGSLPT
jgi:hypothetical protein